MHDAEVANRHQEVGQPRDQHIPVIIEAKESEADPQQIAVEEGAPNNTRQFGER